MKKHIVIISVALFILCIYNIVNIYNEKIYIKEKQEQYEKLELLFYNYKKNFEIIMQEASFINESKKNYIIRFEDEKRNGNSTTDRTDIFYIEQTFYVPNDEALEEKLNKSSKLKNALEYFYNINLIEYITFDNMNSISQTFFCINTEEMSFKGMACYIWYCENENYKQNGYKMLDENWYMYIPDRSD